jgi:hypothetical protein
MKRFELYVWLTTFFRPINGQSESSSADRLWLLPWHVPPIAKSALAVRGRDQVPQRIERQIAIETFLYKFLIAAEAHPRHPVIGSLWRSYKC